MKPSEEILSNVKLGWFEKTTDIQKLNSEEIKLVVTAILDYLDEHLKEDKE